LVLNGTRNLSHPITNNIAPQTIGTMEKEERDTILSQLKNAGLSIRELERATGIARGIIAKS
jgi:putative transposase